MTKNIGTIDRAIRVIVGLVLIALVFVGPQTPWGWLDIIPLGTALIGWCSASTPAPIRPEARTPFADQVKIRAVLLVATAFPSLTKVMVVPSDRVATRFCPMATKPRALGGLRVALPA